MEDSIQIHTYIYMYFSDKAGLNMAGCGPANEIDNIKSLECLKRIPILFAVNKGFSNRCLRDIQLR